MSVPFARWDRDRIVSWFNEIGLNMYLAELRRWCRNGDQLLKASPHDLEKVRFSDSLFLSPTTFLAQLFVE